MAARWRDLGTQLLTYDTVGVLDVIKADHPNDVSACCNKMFVKWLELQPNATWSQLIIALGNIGMKATAENVIKHLIKGLCSNHCRISCQLIGSKSNLTFLPVKYLIEHTVYSFNTASG